jgi:hypothetical protein
MATGMLDSAGELHFIARGNREEIIAEILQKGADGHEYFGPSRWWRSPT